MEGGKTAVACRAHLGNLGSPFLFSFFLRGKKQLETDFFCPFNAGGPPYRKVCNMPGVSAISSSKEGPTAAQRQVRGRLENSKQTLVVMVIFLTYFIQPWHFASRVPQQQHCRHLLMHHDEDLVLGSFVLLFLILSKAIWQPFSRAIARKPASVIHALLFIHEFCAETCRRPTGLLQSVYSNHIWDEKSTKTIKPTIKLLEKRMLYPTRADVRVALSF